ncbi:MAG TPA: hypothetical protein VHY20_07050, partial [Pirellulales bacterium]|nr:hypothetical protein [Pirellulales bacterium]
MTALIDQLGRALDALLNLRRTKAKLVARNATQSGQTLVQIRALDEQLTFPRSDFRRLAPLKAGQAQAGQP